MSLTPKRYTTATAIEALKQAARTIAKTTPASTVHRVERLTIDDLVSSRELSNTTLRNALELLADTDRRIERAIASTNSGDRVSADDEFQRLRNLLTELFCCRRHVGEGFAVAVNGLLSAHENLQGRAASGLQLAAFASVIRKLQREPLLTEEQVIDSLALLEERGLTVEPAGFDALADWLSE